MGGREVAECPVPRRAEGGFAPAANGSFPPLPDLRSIIEAHREPYFAECDKEIHVKK